MPDLALTATLEAKVDELSRRLADMEARMGKGALNFAMDVPSTPQGATRRPLPTSLMTMEPQQDLSTAFNARPVHLRESTPTGTPTQRNRRGLVSHSRVSSTEPGSAGL